MGLQLRFGIFGATIGAFIGIIGGLVGGMPFGIIVLRTLLSALICALLGFALYFIINTFLPELLKDLPSGSDEPVMDPDGVSSSGQAINIVMPEEDYASDNQDPAGDQASALRDVVGGNNSSFASGDDGGGLMEEVSEDRRQPRLSGEGGPDGSFNEDAFFQGVERLPDIGGFSEEFKAQDADGMVVGEDGKVTTSDASTKKKASGKGGNMDPELIAQAIRTALKKEDY